MGLRSAEETGPRHYSDRGLGQISVRQKENVLINPLSGAKDLHLACLKLPVKLVTSICLCGVYRKGREKHPPEDSQQTLRSASPSSSVPGSRCLSDTHLPVRERTNRIKIH